VAVASAYPIAEHENLTRALGVCAGVGTESRCPEKLEGEKRGPATRACGEVKTVGILGDKFKSPERPLEVKGNFIQKVIPILYMQENQ